MKTSKKSTEPIFLFRSEGQAPWLFAHRVRLSAADDIIHESPPSIRWWSQSTMLCNVHAGTQGKKTAHVLEEIIQVGDDVIG